MRQHGYGFGVLLVVVGGVFTSTNGIMLRGIEQADGWQILFYRGPAFSITLFLIKNCERLVISSVAMMQLAFIRLTRG